MKRTNHLLTFLGCLLLSISFLPIIKAQASPDHQKVYDEANLLTAEEEQHLEELCSTYGKKGKADLVIVTTDGSTGLDCEVYLEDMYDRFAFGYNQAYGDTVMIIVDMGSREVCIEGYGLAETQVDRYRGDYIREQITPDLSAGYYYDAFCDFTKLSAKCMKLKAGISPDSPLISLPFQLCAALSVAAIAVSIMAYHSEGRTTTNSNTYLDRAGSDVLAHRDDFIRTTTTRVRRSQSSSGSGGSRSGGGGGRSSGGHSHSTSRGRF